MTHATRLVPLAAMVLIAMIVNPTSSAEVEPLAAVAENVAARGLAVEVPTIGAPPPIPVPGVTDPVALAPHAAHL